MRTFKLIVTYDGAAYAGWQVQPVHTTVQGTIEWAIAEITRSPVRVVGSGRTDAGVHAIGQVVSFNSDTKLPVSDLKRALNARLPLDISVTSCEEVEFGFHAIRDATSKRYRYIITDRRPTNPFERFYTWQFRCPLDDAAMERASRVLVGRHDFASFQTRGSARPSTVRTVSDLTVCRPEGPESHTIHIEIEADGFLYNMVRNIVGTLTRVGDGSRSEAWIGEVLATGRRQSAGPTAPPQGLYLLHVTYGPVVRNCDEIAAGVKSTL